MVADRDVAGSELTRPGRSPAIGVFWTINLNHERSYHDPSPDDFFEKKRDARTVRQRRKPRYAWALKPWNHGK